MSQTAPPSSHAATVAFIPFGDDAAYRRGIILILMLFAIFNVGTGPVRWILAISHLSPLIYVSTLGILIGVLWSLYRSAMLGGLTGTQICTLLILLYATFIGLMFVPAKQALFGAYVLLPFYFGLATANVIFDNMQRLKKGATIFWAIACIGIMLNASLTYPWEGFEYEVAGQSIETSRDWQDSWGGKRVAGLARSSFDAAIQVQLLATILIMLRTGFWGNFVIWIATAVAIYITTSKGVYNIFLMLTPFVLLKSKFPEVLARLTPMFFGLIGLALPLSALFFTFVQSLNDPFWAALTFSFLDRLNNMWPEAWALIAHHGNPFLGRGMGGLGTAQNYFEPLLFNAGDNLFMYWFVILGWPGLPIFLALLAASLWLKPWSRPKDALPFILTVATLVYGITANVVENAFFAMTCGMVTHYLAARLRELLSGGLK